MQTYDTFWQKLFAKRIQEAASREGQRIVAGNAADFAEYKYQAGIVRGLIIAHEMIEEVNTEINKAEKGSS